MGILLAASSVLAPRTGHENTSSMYKPPDTKHHSCQGSLRRLQARFKSSFLGLSDWEPLPPHSVSVITIGQGMVDVQVQGVIGIGNVVCEQDL